MRNVFTYSIGLAMLFCTLFSTNIASAKDGEKVPSNGISFKENKGQLKDQHANLRDDIDFSVNLGNFGVYIGDAQIHYQWSQELTGNEDAAFDPDPMAIMKQQREELSSPVAIQRLDVELIGANKNATIVTGDQDSYYDRYPLGANGDLVNAYSYKTITYKDIYPNIDWVLYAKNGQLKYDFVVHPGGNVLDIKIQYKGADKIETSEGNVTIHTAMGSITEQAPYSYNADTKEPIASSFEVSGNVLRFGVADYDGTLVIDPWLEWATYYGGTNQEWSNCSATDLMGNVYMGGWTWSSNNIVTSGAYQDTLTPHTYTTGTNYNGFIVKFNVAGVRQWATYFPGQVSDIVCANNGDIYFCGSIDSIVGLATTGAHQDTFGGRGIYTGYYYQGDAYLAKFNSSGQRVWFTYYGGAEHDMGTSVALDNNGDVYLAGSTSSLTNIATQGSFQDTLQLGSYYPGGYYWGNGGFLAKFNSSGVRQWGTYFNGTISDITTDLNNNIYCTGNTWHDSGVATAGAHQTFHSASISSSYNYWESFLVKFSSAGSRIWGTYYGGFQYDWGMAVECDPSGNVYLAGNTQSTQFMATPGAHQTSLQGSYDAYLAKFTPSGVRSWGTYFGGTSYEYGGSLVVTPSYKVFLTGSTISTNGIATTNAYQSTHAGSYDDFIAEFDTAGVQQYGTYYGGTGQEYSWGYGGYGWGNGGDALAYNYTGRLHMASSTYSSSNISTPGAHQTTSGSSHDAYMATFIIDTIAYFVHPFPDTVFCAGDTVRIPYKTSYRFNNNNTFTMELSDASGAFGSPVTIGSRVDTVGDTITCVIPLSTPTGTGYRMRIVSTTPTRTSVDNFIDLSVYNPGTVTASNNGPLCAGDTLRLTSSINNTSTVSYSWTGANSFTSSTQNPVKLNAAVADAGDYIVTASVGGCTSLDTTTVVVNPIPAKPQAGSNTPVCPNTTLSLFATHGSSSVSYSWTGPNSFVSATQNPSINNATYAMAGDYIVTVTENGCTSEADTATVVIAITTPTPQANSNSPVCSGQQLILTASSINNATYSWTGPNSFTSTQQNPSIPNASATIAGTYYVKATVNGCESLQDSVAVVVNPSATVAIFPSPGDSICVGETATFVAITNNGGGSPTYTWIKNGTPVSGASGTSYNTSNLNSGDIIACLLSNIPNCPGHTDTSNKVTMTVRPVTAPTVSITANPNTPLEPMQLVTFTATTTYGGNNPTFQWMRNGNPVVGATNNIWGTYQMSDGDSIYVILNSSDRCADPDTAISNGIKVAVLVSVDDIGKLGNVTLFPNPNRGTFTIKGQLNSSKEVTINVMNAIGQTVYRGTAKPNGTELKHTVNIGTELATGTYILHLQNEDAAKTLRFTISK